MDLESGKVRFVLVFVQDCCTISSNDEGTIEFPIKSCNNETEQIFLYNFTKDSQLKL